MWPLRSVGYRTDLFVCAFDGIVEDHERYVVIRTPSNPSFWWGNYLLYPEAPAPGDAPTWLADHARELPGIPATLLAWDCPDGAQGDLQPFLDDGFALDDGTILTARRGDLRRAKAAPDVSVIPLTTDAHWRDAITVLTNAFAPNRSGSLEALRDFTVKQCARYRAMQEADIGQWYGAVVDGELAGALGVVRDRELGRFQLVGTDPRFARRGVCSTLVHDAAALTLERPGIETLVMAADATYHAAKVYEGVGFRPTERLVSVIKKPAKA
jgi:ribosomal protein S18 acetylase RimI-like enzyme